MRKPNLIVFLPDQQRRDTIACYKGGAKVHAPHLAKLASESFVFERAYVTQPVCTPSRSALLTGLWPHQSGCTRNSVPLLAQHRSIVELLADPDYRAAYFGKWHLGDETKAQHGFHDWLSTEGVSDYAGFLQERGYQPDKADGSFSTRLVSDLPLEVSKPRFLEANACSYIEQHSAQPFILFVAFVEPHSPYHGPLDDEHSPEEIEPNSNRFGPDEPLRYRLMREWQENEALLNRKKFPMQYFFGTTPEEYASMKRRYLGLITMVDRSLGAILESIERAGIAEHTVVVHTSDHGDMLGEHRLFGKEVMFDGATRVPLLVRMRGQKSSTRVHLPVSHIDFVPTLLQLLGKDPTPPCAGRSFAPLLAGESIAPAPVFIEWSPNRTKIVKRSSVAWPWRAKRAMNESSRTVVLPDGWKLTLRDQDECELYNLNDDPNEMRNLYRESAYRAQVQTMAAEIFRWQESVVDPLRLPGR